MKNLTFIFILPLLLFFCTICSGQNDTLNQVTTSSLTDTLKAKELYLEALSLMKKRNYQKAISNLKSAKETFINVFGKESIKVSKTYFQLMKCYYLVRDLSKSEVAIKECLNIQKLIYDSRREEIGLSYYFLGVILKAQGKFKEATGSYENAIEVLSGDSCKNINYIIGSYNNLGDLLNKQGQFDLAINIFDTGIKLNLRCDKKNLSVLSTLYTNKGRSYDGKALFNKAVEQHLEALTIREKLHSKDDINLIPFLNNLGVTYNELGKHDKAIQQFNRSLEITTNKLGSSDINLAKCNYNLGISYQYKGDNVKAKEFLFKSLKLNSEENRQVLYGKGISYMAIGALYDDLGDYDKSINHYDKALSILVNILGENHPSIAGLYLNIASALSSKREIDKAIEFNNIALEIQKRTLGENHVDLAKTHNNLGLCYSRKKEFAKAIENEQKALKLKLDFYGEQHLSTANTLNNLGRSFFHRNEFDRALDYYNRALNICLSLVGENHPMTSKIYHNLGMINHKLSYYEEAENKIKKAISSLNYTNKTDLSAVAEIPELIYTFNYLGDFYRSRFEITNDKNQLVHSVDVYNKAFTALNYLSNNFHSNSKSNLSIQAKATYNGAFDAHYALYQITDSIAFLEKGFELAERSRSFLLYEKMNESKILEITDIPKRLLRKENELRNTISSLDKKRYEKRALGLNITDPSILEISKSLFSSNQEYEALKKQFEKEYPKYFKSKYNLSSMNIKGVQNELLKPNQSIVEYMVGDSNLFIILIQKENFEVLKTPKDFPIEKWVNDLTKEGIYGFYTTTINKRTSQLETKTITNYTKAAQQLYEKLIAPIKDKLTKEVIIIPDGVLGYVPFEALLTKRPPRVGAFQAYPFLVKEHQISYCYSATLLKEMRDKQHREIPQNSLLAMAPFYLGDVGQLKEKIDTNDFEITLRLRDSLG